MLFLRNSGLSILHMG